MKKQILFLLAAILFTACQTGQEKKEDATIINGQIANFTEQALYYSYDNTTDTVALDSLGNFAFELEITSPTFVTFKGRDKWKGFKIFVEPKTTTTINADENNTAAITFSGDNKAVNTYSAAIAMITDTTNIFGGKLVGNEDFNGFQTATESLFANYQQHLDTLKANWGEEEAVFIGNEETRLQVYKSLLYLTHLNILTRQTKEMEEIKIATAAEIAKVDLDDPYLIKLDEFNALISELINLEISKRPLDQPIETMEQYVDVQFQAIDTLIINNTIREYAYYKLITKTLRYYGVETIAERYEIFKEFATNEQYLNEINAEIAEYDKLLPGQPSVNWAFPDINGNTVKLSDFKGKYVYIDVWATWCRPCLMETPALRNLMEQYADKNIQFVQISVDEDREAWAKMVTEKNMGGAQLHAGSWDNEICKFFKINGIPRFILIDTEGNIVNSNAARPSDENITEELNKLFN